MLANLLFCLNATIPLFLLLILGMVFTKLNIFDEVFIAKLNNFVFQIALPVLVFYDLCREDFYSLWDSRFVLFCFIVTALSIALTCAIAFLLPDKSTRGEFIQSAYRSDFGHRSNSKSLRQQRHGAPYDYRLGASI